MLLREYSRKTFATNLRMFATTDFILSSYHLGRSTEQTWQFRPMTWTIHANKPYLNSDRPRKKAQFVIYRKHL